MLPTVGMVREVVTSSSSDVACHHGVDDVDDDDDDVISVVVVDVASVFGVVSTDVSGLVLVGTVKAVVVVVVVVDVAAASVVISGATDAMSSAAAEDDDDIAGSNSDDSNASYEVEIMTSEVVSKAGMLGTISDVAMTDDVTSTHDALGAMTSLDDAVEWVGAAGITTTNVSTTVSV
jgi:hypothetical protein